MSEMPSLNAMMSQSGGVKFGSQMNLQPVKFKGYEPPKINLLERQPASDIFVKNSNPGGVNKVVGCCSCGPEGGGDGMYG